jgi:hypothetical protein
MARKAPNFNGFTLKDIAKANSRISNAILNNAKNSTAKDDNVLKIVDYKTNDIPPKIDSNNAKHSNAKNSIAINDAAKNVNQALFSRVKDYLYGLLGDKESVEVKLNEIIDDLSINPHSFYRYLKMLRETDFIVVKLRYSTKISRR